EELRRRVELRVDLDAHDELVLAQDLVARAHRPSGRLLAPAPPAPARARSSARPTPTRRGSDHGRPVSCSPIGSGRGPCVNPHGSDSAGSPAMLVDTVNTST